MATWIRGQMGSGRPSWALAESSARAPAASTTRASRNPPGIKPASEGSKPASEGDAWLAKQLRYAREQLDKKATLCDQLAHEIHALQEELDARSCTARDIRQQLNAANVELRAAATASAADRAAHEEEVTQLRSELSEGTWKMKAAEFGPSMQTRPEEEVEEVSRSLLALYAARASEKEEALRRSEEANHQCEASWAHALRLKDAELQQLREDCGRERWLHDEAVRLLEAYQQDRQHEADELSLELSSMSHGLEKKEDEIVSIQFDMVELQCRLRDQSQLVINNADAFQQASEELADRDGQLELASARQEELLSEMNVVSSKLQDKVTRLTQELEGSRKAHQALDEHTRTVVARLESDRDALVEELRRVRAEAANETAALRQRLKRHQEAAQEIQEALESQLREARVRADQEPLQEKVTTRQRELEERLAAAQEQLAVAEARLPELTSALERSRLLERQARERAQEYRTSLELHREFGMEGFLAPRSGSTESGYAVAEAKLPYPPLAVPAPLDRLSGLHPCSLPAISTLPRPTTTVATTAPVVEDRSSEGPAISSVLIAVELDLGRTGAKAVLSVAPWQTRSDFDAVVAAFLEEHRVRPLFAMALVRFLEKVENEADTFPARVRAALADVYSRYGSDDSWQDEG
mmetsp:Transcript_68975/g.133092  ORF Transcript_68975/g.133092 Transcript_68975/m.133092 type:complete len:644 (+) Transcript_68975:41-1972(+)